MKTHLLAAFVLAGLTSMLLTAGIPATAAAAGPVQHEVVGTDNLHLLAGYYYENPRRWKEIYQANRELLHGSTVLQPGMMLTIPGENRETFPIPYAEWKDKVQR